MRRPARTMLLRVLGAACVLALSCATLAPAASGPGGLPYSNASANKVQAQPPASSCHARGAGIYAAPDPRCTPGALNPAVAPSTLGSTICRSGWTSTVRPRESITAREKIASMHSYGDFGRTSAFEYDHLVPLELGGAVNDARNLWPEPDYALRAGFYLNPKDRLERALNRLVCRGAMSLGRAQVIVATEWVAAYHRYG